MLNLPPPPTIYSLSPSSGKQAGGDDITITGADFVAAQVTFGGKGATCTVAASATIITCKTPSNPAGIVDVIVETPVGTASSSFTYLPVPVIDNISPTDGPTTGDTEVTITGENLKDGTVTIGGLACPVSSSSVNQIVCKTPLWPWIVSSSGVDVFVITAGGTSNSLKFHFTETPTITGISPAEGLTSGGYNVTITGNYLGDGSLTFPGCNQIGVSATQVSCTVPAGSALVARRVDVFVTTTFGKSNTVQFNYKPPAPTITGISPSSGLTTGGDVMTITGNYLTYTSEAGTILATVSVDGLSCSNPSGTVNQIKCSIPAHTARGIVNLIASSAGGQAIASFTYYPPAPIISSISNDARGMSTGLYTVTIEGEYLTGATSVSFGGTAASSFTVLSDTQITCVVPAHAVGDVNVVVTTPTPGGGPSNNKTFTYFPPPPIISSITPLFGLTSVGKTVTISGSYLTGGTVKFGDTTATCAVTADTTITCTSPTVPEPAAGMVYVVVTSPYGSTLPTVFTSFNYYKTPVIDSILPVTGLVIGGESVTITGTGNLTGGTVTVGGVNCPVTSSSITSITCRTSAHAAGLVKAIVTTAAGSSNGLDFTYKYGKPSLSSITPNVGTKNTNVVIRGTNLTGGTVKIGGVIETACTLVSDSEITCTKLPTHSNGTVSVTVTNPDGVVSTETITFTYQ